MLFAAAAFGFVFGFVGSIPVGGPIAVMVISRGLADRARSALYLGSGAAIAEGAYAYVAFRGFSEVLTRYAWVEPASRIAGALILTGLGLRFARGLDGEGAAQTRLSPRAGAGRSFLLGLAITSANPVLIAAWTAALTVLYGLGLLSLDPGAALPFSIGASAGITIWFATLLGLLRRFQSSVSRAAIDRLVRGMGVALILLGLVCAARAAYRV